MPWGGGTTNEVELHWLGISVRVSFAMRAIRLGISVRVSFAMRAIRLGISVRVSLAMLQ